MTQLQPMRWEQSCWGILGNSVDHLSMILKGTPKPQVSSCAVTAGVSGGMEDTEGRKGEDWASGISELLGLHQVRKINLRFVYTSAGQVPLTPRKAIPGFPLISHENFLQSGNISGLPLFIY